MYPARRILLLLLLHLLASCAHRPPAPEPAAPLLPADVDLLYTFELVASPFRMVRVTVATRGAAAGATTFALGGDVSAEDAVHGVAAVDASQHPLAVAHATPREWSVRHAPSEPLELSYYLVSPSRAPTSGLDRPIANEAMFRSTGDTALAFPKDRQAAVQRVEFRWRGFDAVGWKVATSFSADQHGFRVERPIDDLRRALFLAGDLRLYTRAVRGAPVQFALAADLGARDEEVVDRTARIVESERAFFSDFERPYFLVVLQGEGGARSSSAVLLTDTLAVSVAPAQQGPAAPRPELEVTIARELFHDWLGRRIKVQGPEALGTWFRDGFAAFYARRLLFRSGLLPLADYVTDLNQRIEGYLLDPDRTATNARIGAESRTHPSLGQLAAQRGALVALLVDGEIRRFSDGERSIDDLMHELYERATQGGHTFDTDELLFAIERYTTREFAMGMRAIIELGATPRFPSDLLSPCLAMQVAVRGGYELGFDLDASLKTRVITGVVPGSRAYQSGLRNGQRLAQWELTPGKPDEPVSLTVIDAGQPRLIFYVPIAAGVPVPVFSVGNHPAACADIL